MTKMNINDSSLNLFNCILRMFEHLQTLIDLLRLRNTSEFLAAMLACFSGSRLRIEFVIEKDERTENIFCIFFFYSYCRFASLYYAFKGKSNRLFVIISFNNQNKLI